MTASISNFSHAVTTAGDGVAIIAATSSIKSTTLPLLQAALSLPPPSDPVATTSSPAQSLTALSATSGPLVLVHDPLSASSSTTITPAVAPDPSATATKRKGGSTATAAAPTTVPSDPDAVDPSFALATSLAGVLLLSVRMVDIPRPRAAGIPQLIAAVQGALTLGSSATTALPAQLPTRRLLVAAVRDYDSAVANEDEVHAAVKDAFVTAFSSSSSSPASPETSTSTLEFDDVFDLHVACLPSETLLPNEFATAAKDLGNILRDANKKYADEAIDGDTLTTLVDRLAAVIASGDSAHDANAAAAAAAAAKDLPTERELQAAFACSGHMQAVLERFRHAAKVWKASVEAGRVVRYFGAENDRLIDRTLDVYDKDAGAHRTTAAFSRKREELLSTILADSYALFAKQVLKVREDSYQVFRAKLARIRINDQVEKNVRGAVKEAEAFFVRSAETLKCKHGNWRYDNERHELVNHMRDDATERLQLARLQGNYVPNMRAPIAFAFHTLLLAPFGRDSRAAAPQEEMKQTFDPDKAKQPGMMRSRPRQRGEVFSLGEKESCGKDVLDEFSNMFDDIIAED